MGMFPVTSAATVEAIEADIQAARIVLCTDSASICEQVGDHKMKGVGVAYRTYYRVEALRTVFSVDWLRGARGKQLCRMH
jgi:histidine ammonia-lyase